MPGKLTAAFSVAKLTVAVTPSSLFSFFFFFSYSIMFSLFFRCHIIIIFIVCHFVF